ncbi:MAG TPA: amino acid ABC transporter ATP-binding protein [Nordella sp.]|nr:amino acid ABC transporter ATP-binding protein [Nordella sp.]
MIRLAGIEKNYGDGAVLKGISLEVAKGEVVCLIGPSGSGKSTLLRCINYLEQPNAGTIAIDGVPVFFDNSPQGMRPHPVKQIAAVRARLGMVFQEFNLFPHLTAIENVMEGPVSVLGLSRLEANARALQLLERVGLVERADYYPEELSGGQRQRTAIARALAMNPIAILFDEPTSALDPELVHEVLEVMRQLRRDGMTMIIATHEMNFARDIADRVVFLADGLVVETDSPDQLFSAPKHPRTRDFLRSILKR